MPLYDVVAVCKIIRHARSLSGHPHALTDFPPSTPVPLGERVPSPMNTTPSDLEMLRLEKEGQHLSVVVLGRHSPGLLSPLHDVLSAEIIIHTQIGTLRLETTIASMERAAGIVAGCLPLPDQLREGQAARLVQGLAHLQFP